MSALKARKTSVPKGKPTMGAFPSTDDKTVFEHIQDRKLGSRGNIGRVRSYISSHFSSFVDQGSFVVVGYYTPMLLRMLKDSKIKVDENLQETFNRLFKGKTVIEIGCRNGGFLKFASDHGARVAGSTSRKYMKRAKGLLSGRALKLIESDGEMAGYFLQKLEPDYIVSLNLFDGIRWGSSPIPLVETHEHNLNCINCLP